MVAVRQSPLHSVLEHLHPHWIQIHGMPAVLHFGHPELEVQQAKTLGLCDVSSFPRMGVKGNGGKEWLIKHGVPVPDKIYGHAVLAGGDGMIIRTGTNEMLVEDRIGGDVLPGLRAETDGSLANVHRFHRHDAAMFLSGERALAVLAETCSYNFRQPDADLIFTRVAGVSCGILTTNFEGLPLYHIWCDGSFGAYLWEQLLEIASDHGGHAVGLSAFYPSTIQ